MIEEQPEMRAVFVEKGVLPAEDTEPEEVRPGLDTYWVAWHMLRDDRHFGAMGGCSGIYYSAISRYASDHGIRDDEFHVFVVLIRAMDAEFLAWSSEQSKKPPENFPVPPEIPT